MLKEIWTEYFSESVLSQFLMFVIIILAIFLVFLIIRNLIRFRNKKNNPRRKKMNDYKKVELSSKLEDEKVTVTAKGGNSKSKIISKKNGISKTKKLVKKAAKKRK